MKTYLKKLAVATLVSFMAIGSVPSPIIAKTLETPISDGESSQTSKTMNVQSPESDIDYILDTLSNADLDREFSFFPLEEVDKNLQPFNSRSSLIKFDTVEEAIEFFKVLSRDMNHAHSVVYADLYDSNSKELFPVRDSTGISSVMAQGGAWSLWTVYNRNVSYTFNRNNAGLKTVTGVVDSWPTAMVQVAASWTHRHGNIQVQPGQSSFGRISATGTWLFGIEVGGFQIGSTTNDTWSNMPVSF